MHSDQTFSRPHQSSVVACISSDSGPCQGAYAKCIISQIPHLGFCPHVTKYEFELAALEAAEQKGMMQCQA